MLSNHVGESGGNRVALFLDYLTTHLHYLPVFTAIFIVTSLFISYGVSVHHGHVEPDFPYISYTAVEVPERCIFAQLINMGALLMGANVYIRFLQQRELYKVQQGQSSHRHHKNRLLVIISLVCGWLSAFGMSMVANFQTIVMRPPHYVGAGLAFGMGVVYCWLQTSISLRHQPRDRMTVPQAVISTFLTLSLVTFAVSKAIFKTKEARGEGTREVELRPVYLVSTVTEWLTVIAVVVFALTFYPDFSRIVLHGPTVQISDQRRAHRGRAEDNLQLETVNNHDAPPV